VRDEEIERGCIPWTPGEFFTLHNAAVGRARSRGEAFTPASIVDILHERYSSRMAAAHFVRYLRIHDFIDEYHDRLHAARLLGPSGLNFWLIAALAAAEFTQPVYDVERDATVWRFDYAVVLRLMARIHLPLTARERRRRALGLPDAGPPRLPRRAFASKIRGAVARGSGRRGSSGPLEGGERGDERDE
jgi:hypothetical protein